MTQSCGNRTSMSRMGMEIHVQSRRRPRKQGFDSAKACAEFSSGFVHHASFSRPHPGKEAFEVDVLGDSTKEGHGKVGVQVHQARHDEMPAGIDDEGCSPDLRLMRLSDSRDPATDDGDGRSLEDRMVDITGEEEVGPLDDHIGIHPHFSHPQVEFVPARSRAAASMICNTVSVPEATTASTSSIVMGAVLSPAAGFATRQRDA